MGSPLDIAAGAAGFVSFGITACQGLLAYYNAYRAEREDVAAAHSAVQRLEETLTDIQSKVCSISRIEDGSTGLGLP